MSQEKAPNRFLPLLLVLAFACALALGLAGIDFGNHWDEHKLVRSVRETYRTTTFLPGWYNYPSVSYNLMFAASLPDAICTFAAKRAEGMTPVLESIQDILRSKDFLPRARPFFLFASLLAGVWVYALAAALSKSRQMGLLAALLLFSSWEFAYHARWAAPDGLLAQFGILTVLLVILSIKSEGYGKIRWLALAAVAAGLACGAKYYGGMFLLPVWLGGLDLARRRGWRWRGMALLGLGLAAVFAASFLLSTPGLLLEPERALKDIRFEMNHYSDGHFGYSVQPGPQHWGLALSYLALAAFSPYAPVALAVFLLTLVGIYSLVKQRGGWMEAVVFLSIPVIHLAYMGLQKVLFVRNYQVLMPFLAVLAVYGLFFVWKTVLPVARPARIVFAVLVAAGLTANFAWQYGAALSIQNRERVDLSAQLGQYLRDNPNLTFHLSPRAQKLLPDASFPNLAVKPQDAQVFLYLSEEIKDPLSNRFGLYETPFGPYEVNFNYYPSWDGDSRLVTVRMSEALHHGLMPIK